MPSTILTAKQVEELEARRLKQRFFNIICAKMCTQNSPGLAKNTALLRASEGKRCSLGWLISDRFYEERFEKLCPNEVLIDILEMPPLGYQFYEDLQMAHDRSAKADDWPAAFSREMRAVAAKHFLDPSSLTLFA